MLTLEQMSDRLELQQLVIDYANAIDARAWDRLDAVFTPEAYIDYRAMGGADGRYPQIKAWLAQALAPFPAYMHFVGNFAFEIEGDTARGRIACFNPMEVPRPDGGGSDVMLLGLWYVDRYQRTAQGWRISERVEERCYDHNMPDWMRQMLAQAAAKN